MKRPQNLSAIDTNTPEGRLLMAALAVLTTQPSLELNKKTVAGTQMEPDQMLEQVYLLQEKMYKNATPIPEEVVSERPTFPKALETLINQYSMEKAGGNTPDFLLAEFLNGCLTVYGQTVNRRDHFKTNGKVPLF